jgi:hypothetical protein
MDTAQERGESFKGNTVELKVTVLKNRNGQVNEETRLNFNLPLLTIKDKTGSW